jgi:hypothetical protein
VAQRASLMQWPAAYAQDESAALRAVGAGLASRPHRGVAFLVGFASVAAIALCMRGARRRGWRAARVSSSIAAFTGLGALWLVERVWVPAELHQRVVTWVGPSAAWEIGVDAVRPRSTRAVTVTSPAPPAMATVLGAAEGSSEARRERGVDARGDPVWRVTSTVGSSSALTVSWMRHAGQVGQGGQGGQLQARPGRAPVELRDGVIHNHLDVPLRALVAQRGARVSGPLAPHASRAIADFAFASSHEEPHSALSVLEQRLLHEVAGGCTARLGTLDDDTRCAAAIAVLDDGTLLGIEVSR